MHSEPINHIPFRSELYRKLTHLGALVIPGGYYYLGLERSEALYIMIPIAVGMLIIDIARLRNWSLWRFFRPLILSMAREHEMKGDFTGAAYILVTACLVIAFYDKPVAVACLVFIMVGDSAAALIGRKFGKHKFGHKSIEGSLAFCVSAVLMAFVLPELPLYIGIIGAVVATVTEALSTRIDDNASVPLVSGLVMHLLIRIF